MEVPNPNPSFSFLWFQLYPFKFDLKKKKLTGIFQREVDVRRPIIL